MKKLLNGFVLVVGLSAISGLVPACSCGDDDDGNNNPDANDTIDASDVDADPNAFPALGNQIDRAGRPGITTALIRGLIFTDGADQSAVRDMYNSDDNAAGWATAFQDEIELHLGIYDSVDALGMSGCGNQAFYTVADNYETLAGALVDDRLLINTTQAVCNGYLAVETGVTDDCGGRTPTMDVIDVTYTALAGVAAGDNVDADGSANDNAFPFLGMPLTSN